MATYKVKGYIPAGGHRMKLLEQDIDAIDQDVAVSSFTLHVMCMLGHYPSEKECQIESVVLVK